MRILVSGSSGLIGTELLPSLNVAQHDVSRLARGKAGKNDVQWDPERPLSPKLVEGFDAVVHLAGETIVGRWTPEKKAQIRNSRVEGTRNLVDALVNTARKPRLLITASAIGYYGDRGDELLREGSLPGRGFLPEVCKEWEAATQPAAQAGIRCVQMRFGIVLSGRGGALRKMLPPFRLGLGGNVGSGRQYWSWISIADVVGAVHHILRMQSVQGPVNIVAPQAVTNADFTLVLAHVLHRPAFLPIPAFAARLALGEMADELLLASQRVEPVKLVASAYEYQQPDLVRALHQALLAH
jgi:uncharacterized protein